MEDYQSRHFSINSNIFVFPLEFTFCDTVVDFPDKAVTYNLISIVLKFHFLIGMWILSFLEFGTGKIPYSSLKVH